jgi:hypothetical protein
MARLIRRISFRQVLPRRPCAEHPQDPVEDIPRIPPGASASVAPHTRLREEPFENGPLRVGQIHTLRYDRPQEFVHTPVVGFMR